MLLHLLWPLTNTSFLFVHSNSWYHTYCTCPTEYYLVEWDMIVVHKTVISKKYVEHNLFHIVLLMLKIWLKDSFTLSMCPNSLPWFLPQTFLIISTLYNTSPPPSFEYPSGHTTCVKQHMHIISHEIRLSRATIAFAFLSYRRRNAHPSATFPSPLDKLDIYSICGCLSLNF